MTYIRINCARWAGHIMQLEKDNPTTRITHVATVEGRQHRSRPRLRWEYGVADDVNLLGERNWQNVIKTGTFGRRF